MSADQEADMAQKLAAPTNWRSVLFTPVTFPLTVGGTTFNGTVQANGDFAANAVFGPDGRGNTFTQRLGGRFTATGFTGRLEVAVSPQACAFTRDWTATKQGTPNVFP